jgi:hypothetical protein
MNFGTTPKRSVCAVFALWVLVVLLGVCLLEAYAARPGEPGAPHARWPRTSELPFEDRCLNLLIFLHPKCACSRASIAELAYILKHSGGRVRAHAIVVDRDLARVPQGGRSLLDDLARLPGLSTWTDQGAVESSRFGVATSGHVLLYDCLGRLTYSGGITSARGHVGQSFGRDAVLARITRADGAEPWRPVFGCPLATPR